MEQHSASHNETTLSYLYLHFLCTIYGSFILLYVAICALSFNDNLKGYKGTLLRSSCLTSRGGEEVWWGREGTEWQGRGDNDNDWVIIRGQLLAKLGIPECRVNREEGVLDYPESMGKCP